MLNIEKTVNDAELTLTLSGRLDTLTAPEFETEVNASIEGISLLIMDMAELEYISSAGLRVLLTAQKKMNKQGQMKLVHVNRPIMEIFEVTGFADILCIE